MNSLIVLQTISKLIKVACGNREAKSFSRQYSKFPKDLPGGEPFHDYLDYYLGEGSYAPEFEQFNADSDPINELGKILLNSGAEILTPKLRRLAREFSKMSPKEQRKALCSLGNYIEKDLKAPRIACRQTTVLGNIPTGLGVPHPDISDCFPRYIQGVRCTKTGKSTVSSIDCLGGLLVVSSFLELTGQPYLIANPIPWNGYKNSEQIQKSFMTGLRKFARRKIISLRCFRKAFRSELETAKKLMTYQSGLHQGGLVRLGDQTWYYVDSSGSVRGELEDTSQLAKAFDDLSSFQPANLNLSRFVNLSTAQNQDLVRIKLLSSEFEDEIQQLAEDMHIAKEKFTSSSIRLKFSGFTTAVFISTKSHLVRRSIVERFCLLNEKLIMKLVIFFSWLPAEILPIRKLTENRYFLWVVRKVILFPARLYAHVLAFVPFAFYWPCLIMFLFSFCIRDPRKRELRQEDLFDQIGCHILLGINREFSRQLEKLTLKKNLLTSVLELSLPKQAIGWIYLFRFVGDLEDNLGSETKFGQFRQWLLSRNLSQHSLSHLAYNRNEASINFADFLPVHHPGLLGAMGQLRWRKVMSLVCYKESPSV